MPMLHRLAVLLLCAAAATTMAADWPQFMGPSHNGRSAETGLARSWPDGGPPELWCVPMGKGFGGVAVVGDRVYVQDREGEARDLVRCLDAASGQELWQVGYDAPGKFGFPGSRSVPAVVGNRLYSCGPLGHLVCIDTDTHAILWRHHIWQDFGGGKRPLWAFAQNPLVLGDLVLVMVQTEKAGMVAFAAATGEVRWQSEPLGKRAGYVSPALLKVADRTHLVAVVAGPDIPRGSNPPPAPSGPPWPTVFGLDPATGQVLWRHVGWQCATPASLPIDLGEGRVLLSGGYNAGLAILQVQPAAGGTFQVTEALRSMAIGSHVHSPIVVDGNIYANCTTNERKDGLSCMKPDGSLAWKTGRDPVFDKGGLLYADGMLISVDGQKGILRLIQPNPEKLTVLAEAKVLDGPQCWAPLALADGHLYLRDQKQLKCLDLRAP